MNAFSTVATTMGLFDDELVVDLFCGGGGASEGCFRAIGRHPDIAINHSAEAIAMHTANHPATQHFKSDIWKVSPKEASAGRRVGLLWCSPSCTHFSRAKGSSNPLSAKIRSLPWSMVRWAKEVRPRVIFCENVPEMVQWGPLDADGHPDPRRVGRTFKVFVGKLRGLGYVVEWKNLIAADYGAPTTRKRLFLIARSDGAPIVWPEPTHGKGRIPWASAASIIDWSRPCPSIFLTAEEARSFGVKRPLCDATLRRIAAGIQRYVIGAASPFIVPLTHQGGQCGNPVSEPLRTVTAAHRGELALVSPTLIQTGYGEREGQRPRSLDIHAPLGTVVAGAAKHALVSAFLAKHFGGPNGRQTPGLPMTAPLGAITARDHHGVAAVSLLKFYGTSMGADVREPMPTVTATGQHLAEVRAFLKKYGARIPGPQLALGLDAPSTPLVHVNGEAYEIVDIGLRMLDPDELFAAQGFPKTYRIDIDFNGKPLTKTAKVMLAGNSVSPNMAEAIVSANAPRRTEAAA